MVLFAGNQQDPAANALDGNRGLLHHITIGEEKIIKTRLQLMPS